MDTFQHTVCLQEDEHIRQHHGDDGEVPEQPGRPGGRPDRAAGRGEEENGGTATSDAAKVSDTRASIYHESILRLCSWVVTSPSERLHSIATKSVMDYACALRRHRNKIP